MQENYALFFILALLAEILGTLSGFGSSILFVPIASLFLDFKMVLGITAVFHVFSNLSKLLLFHKSIEKNIAIRLGIPAVISVFLGALLIEYIPINESEVIIQVTILLIALYSISRQAKSIQQTNTNLYIGGGISGFLAGLIGTGGAIRGLILSAFKLEKEVFIATSAMIDMGVDSTRAFVYIFNGYFTKAHIILIPFLIAISFIGTYIGKIILKRIPEKIFHYLVLSIILLVSLSQIGNYLYKQYTH
jgi:hypothetical protein